MIVHESHDMFDMADLVRSLLGYRWQHECEIIPAYMPPFPGDDTRPRCVVMHVVGDHEYFLRYSKGPWTGTDWDTYGDDFKRPELALVELAKAPPPPNVGTVIPTYGEVYRVWERQ